MKLKSTENIIKVYSGNKKAIKVKSLDDVQKCIVDNALLPESGEKFITVIQEVVTVYEVPIQTENLSKENKQLLVDLVIKRIESSHDFFGRFDNPMYIWMWPDRNSKVVMSLLSKIILEKKGYTEEDIIHEIKTYGKEIGQEKNPNSCFYRKMFNDLGDHNFTREAWTHVVISLLKDIDLDELNVEVNLTNYKLCNNIRLFNNEGIDIQIRKKDIIHNQGQVYGHNVSCNKTFALNNSNLTECFKKIEISF